MPEFVQLASDRLLDRRTRVTDWTVSSTFNQALKAMFLRPFAKNSRTKILPLNKINNLRLGPCCLIQRPAVGTGERNSPGKPVSATCKESNPMPGDSMRDLRCSAKFHPGIESRRLLTDSNAP